MRSSAHRWPTREPGKLSRTTWLVLAVLGGRAATRDREARPFMSDVVNDIAPAAAGSVTWTDWGADNRFVAIRHLQQRKN
jgi:hypothetical protein